MDTPSQAPHDAATKASASQGAAPATGAKTQDPSKSAGMLYVMAAVLLGLAFLGIFVWRQLGAAPPALEGSTQDSSVQTGTDAYKGKKILFVNSYHEGLPWSDGIAEGVRGALEGTGAEVVSLAMDTKRNPSNEFGLQAGETVRATIERIQPDVVIACDDPAFKYVMQKFYKDAALPFVFCGVNWDIGRYGGPYANTAGMVEVVLIDKSIAEVMPYAKGTRVGFLTEDTISEVSNAENYGKYAGVNLVQTVYVKNFTEWKAAYLALQDTVDVLAIGVMGSFHTWDDPAQKKELVDFVMQNTRIPTVTEHAWMVEFTLLAYGKVAQEQGTWAARAALQILDGVSPKEIGIVKNTEGELAINLGLAEKLGINFRPQLLKKATVYR